MKTRTVRYPLIALAAFLLLMMTVFSVSAAAAAPAVAAASPIDTVGDKIVIFAQDNLSFVWKYVVGAFPQVETGSSWIPIAMVAGLLVLVIIVLIVLIAGIVKRKFGRYLVRTLFVLSLFCTAFAFFYIKNEGTADTVFALAPVKKFLDVVFSFAVGDAILTAAVCAGIFLVAAIVVLLLLRSIFRLRFFRTLLWILIFAVLVAAVAGAFYVLNVEIAGTSTDTIAHYGDKLGTVLAEEASPVHDLLTSVFSFLSPTFGIAGLGIVLGVLVIVEIILILLLVLACKLSRPRRARKVAASAPADSAVASAPAIHAESVPVSQPAPTQTPATAGTVACTPAESALTAAQTPEVPTTTPEVPVAQEAEAPAAAEPAVAPAPAREPVFMPVPAVVSQQIGFADPQTENFIGSTHVSADNADQLMSDEQAEALTAVVYKNNKGERATVRISQLEEAFLPYSDVDAKILRALGLVDRTVGTIDIVADGTLTKPLMVEAASFTPAARKMITLTGGRAILIA